MVCRGLYFDELDRMTNVRKYQITESAKMNSERQILRKEKSKAVYIERRI